MRRQRARLRLRWMQQQQQQQQQHWHMLREPWLRDDPVGGRGGWLVWQT
jgi:hypothetical protein